MVRQGQLLPDTPAWKEGLADWKRLDQLIVWPAAPVANPQPTAVPASPRSRQQLTFNAFQVRLFCNEPAFRSYGQHELMQMYINRHQLSLRAALDDDEPTFGTPTEAEEQTRLGVALAEDRMFAEDRATQLRVELTLDALFAEAEQRRKREAQSSLSSITPQSPAWQPVPLDLRQQLCFPAFKTRLECHEGFESKRSGWELFKMHASRHPFSLRADNDLNTAPAGELSVEQLEEGLLLALTEDCTKTQDADTRQRIEILTVVILSKRRAKQLAGIRETAPGKGCLSVMVPMVLIGGALCCGFVVLLWQAVRW